MILTVRKVLLARILFLVFLVNSSTYSSQAFAIPSPSSTSTLSQRKADDMTQIRKNAGPPWSPASPYKGNTKCAYSLIPLAEFSIATNPLWKATSLYVLADAVGFVVSVATGSHVHLDLIGTGAFAVASISVLMTAFGGAVSLPLHQKWSSVAVSLWAMKLASFLFFRATRVGHDTRLEDTLSTISGTFGFWFFTFLWNLCCSMPYLLGLLSTRTDPTFVAAGGMVYLVGLAIETTADAQKWLFKQSNPGKFCNVGLWAISQHPNFFGNLVLWAGIFLMNLPAFIDPVPVAANANASLFAKAWSYRRLALALISPAFMWGLFHGQASGMVTNSAQLFASKYGSDPSYQKYLDEVPMIVPKLW